MVNTVNLTEDLESLGEKGSRHICEVWGAKTHPEYEQQYSLTIPLHKKEEVSWEPASITLSFLNVDQCD